GTGAVPGSWHQPSRMKQPPGHRPNPIEEVKSCTETVQGEGDTLVLWPAALAEILSLGEGDTLVLWPAALAEILSLR
ncbi:MAG: hypothetical protein ABFS37_09915, partial [Acidobacteriota bacterium]